MARNENPPFERGLTAYNGATIDPNNLFGFQDVGKDWLFEDVDPNLKTQRTNAYVRCRVVRNVSGGALLPKLLVVYQTSNSPAGGTGQNDPTQTFGSEISGYSVGDGLAPQASNITVPVDEFLPVAGVPNNDCFWVVVEGPAMCRTSVAGPAVNINVGDKVVAASTSDTHSTTAGRVDAVQYATTTAANSTTARQDVRQDADFVGYALSAATTGATDTPILVYIVSHL